MKVYRDHYFLKAKKENYPARSIYKLQELDSRFHVLRKNGHVLDLGAAPGSWSLGAAEKVGPDGVVLSCDLQPAGVEFPQNVHFMIGDIYAPTPEFLEALEEHGPFDLVMSDMAPATTGNKFTDQARSLGLACAALELALAWLKPGGNFVVKIFMGPDIAELENPMKDTFKSVRAFKPKSSRSESKETFYVGSGFKGQPSHKAEEGGEHPSAGEAGQS